jgi:DNA polymerase elongation subunit (family B)
LPIGAISMKLQLGVNSVEYSIASGLPVVHIFGRDDAGNSHRLDVIGFQPYFYLPVDVVKNKMIRVPNEITCIDDVTTYRSIRDEPLYRVYVENPRAIRGLRDRFGGFEADILYQNRYLIDNNIIDGIVFDTQDARVIEGIPTIDYQKVTPCVVGGDARVCIIDIECASGDRFPEAEIDPINCITCWDSFDEVYHTFYLNPPDGVQLRDADLRSVQPLENGCFDPNRHRIYIFDDEISLLRGFVEYIRQVDSDILTGWNYTGFDMPYILTRMVTLGLQPMALSRIPGWMGWNDDRLRGRSVFDLLNGYKRLQQGLKSSYRLDAIAEEELGERKVRYTGTIHDLWVSDPIKLIEYNLTDVHLCVGIDAKNNIIEFFRGIARYVGCSLEQTVNTSQVVDMYVLRRGYGKFVFPSRNLDDVGQEFKGATVLEPSQGIRHNVCVFDLKSLYPMIMMTLNASPETKDPYGELVAPNGVRFRKSPDGLTRSLMADLLHEREHLKAERNKHPVGSDMYKLFDAQQNVVKVIMNSYYGVSGYPKFRLYDRDFGAAVTSTGREIIQYVKKVIESMGYEVIYGDSVAGDSKIEMIRDGQRSEVCIQDLFTRVNATSPDGREYCDLYGVSTETIDAYGKLCVRNVPYVMRHKASKKMYRVWLSNESYIDVTEDHSLFGYFSEMHRSRNLKEYERIVEVKPSELGKKIKSLIVRKKAFADGKSMYSSDELYALFGYFIGNGSFNTAYGNGKNYYCHVSCGEDAESVTKYILEPLQAQGYVCDYWVKPTGDIAFNGQIVGILNGVCRDDTGSKKIPDFMISETTEHIAAFVSGWFSADGTVINRDSGCIIRVSNNHKSWIEELQRLMYRLSISTSIYKGNGINSYDGVCSGSYNYYLNVMNRGRFKEIVGFIQERKQSRLLGVDVSQDRLSTVDVCSNAVISVEEIEYDDYVYDIEVVETHRFFANNILVHNTDSCMCVINGETTDDTIRLAKIVESTLNTSFDEFAKTMLNADQHFFSIKFEKLYETFFQSGKKKRYAGRLVWKEGKTLDELNVSGFETRRSDTSNIAKEMQETVLMMIVNNKSYTTIKQYLRGMVAKFQRGSLSLDDIGIPGGISKALADYEIPDAHIRGAYYSNENLGTNFGAGSKPRRVYIRRVIRDYPTTDVLCFEYGDQVPSCFIVDWEKMMEHSFRPVVRIIEALGLGWDDIDPTVTTLDMYGVTTPA